MKPIFRCLAALTIFGLVAFVFGYFDEELGEMRRWSGSGLIVAGMVLAWPALVRLGEDWPRLKPRHDVDLAFAQIGLSMAMLCLACLMGGRFGAMVRPLVEPTPNLMVPAGSTGASTPDAATSPGASRPARR